ncbi:MAG: ACT domain-containing protein [Clostridia bacterium]|nr:ACT domain-containing protein [Clostridia bacterium]
MERKIEYLLIDTEVLPEIFAKVVEAKRLLRTGVCQTASEAAERLKISRSAFYKYKDRVFPLEEMGKDKIITVLFEVVDQMGVLSGILQVLAAAHTNVLTINQNIPVNHSASITISLRIEEMTMRMDQLLKKLRQVDGVQRLELLSGE